MVFGLFGLFSESGGVPMVRLGGSEKWRVAGGESLVHLVIGCVRAGFRVLCTVRLPGFGFCSHVSRPVPSKTR